MKRKCIWPGVLGAAALFFAAGVKAQVRVEIGQQKDEGAAATANADERVSEYLQNLAETERTEWMDKMKSLVGDIDRVCALSDPQRERLTLAAKGAVDSGLNRWRANMETWVRDKARNVQGDIEQFLAGVGSVRFGDTARTWEPEQQEVWATTLSAVLNESQRKAYDDDMRQRLAFKHESMARALVADLDRTLRLSEKQRGELLPLLTVAAAAHWDRLESWAGDEENLPYHQLGALLGAVPAADRDRVLNEAQRKGWDRFFERFDGAWQSIRNLPGGAGVR
ncbi:MAG: hypothetical protein KGS60_14795 [Verrucomicrobia bacterium]|nr:hypothetical protein [Verrucomicrobiota bacterium]